MTHDKKTCCCTAEHNKLSNSMWFVLVFLFCDDQFLEFVSSCELFSQAAVAGELVQQKRSIDKKAPAAQSLNHHLSGLVRL